MKTDNDRNCRLRLAMLSTIEEYKLLENVKSVLVGLSGGIDSSVLLDAMLSISDTFGITVSAIHVNHCIRGAESDSDEAFVRRICAERGVPLFVRSIDVPSIAQLEDISLETAARNARYAAFSSILQNEGIDAVATAHNADDNAETILLNLVRGSGMNGICGIPHKRDKIIRPLLGVPRSDIEDYAHTYGIPFVCDSTNTDTAYTRNKIRHCVLPVLKSINPSFVRTASAEAKIFTDAKNYLSDCAQKQKDLLSESDPVLIAQYISENAPVTVNSENLIRISNALKNPGKRRFRLSLGYSAITDNGVLSFTQNEIAEANSLSPIHECEKLSKGKNTFVEGKVFVYLDSSPENFNECYNYSTIITVRSANINDSFIMRSRSIGDSLKIRGMTRSLKKEFINIKLPAAKRNLIPVICFEDKPVCVPYIGADERFLCTEGQKHTLTFCFTFDPFADE